MHAFIVGNLGNGGQERQLLYLVQLLEKHKHPTLVIVWGYSPDDKYAEAFKATGTQLVLLSATDSTFSKLSKCRSVIKQYSPKTLHSFTFYLNFFTWLICLFTSTSAIGGIRNRMLIHMQLSGRIAGALSSFFPKAKISNNYLFLEGLPKGWLFNRLKRNTRIVTNHLDLSEYKTHPYKDGSETIFTASIGRLYQEKRVDLLVETIRILVDCNIDIKHFHAGKGPEKDKLVNMINAYNLNDHFIFAGEVQDVNLFLADKYLLIHSADYEGYPNVIMEAMACGKAIVSTDCGDTRFLVEHSSNGYIVPIGDAEQLALYTVKLIRNPVLNKSMAESSRQKAEQLFTLEHLLRETLDTYSSLHHGNNMSKTTPPIPTTKA